MSLLASRRVRLRAAWLLIVPFLWLARPTPMLLAAGAGLALLGLAIRALAAGFIHKQKELTTTGPYAHTRNPLYLGTFFLGLGVAIAGGRWYFPLAFLVFFALVYSRTIRSEAELLEGIFGERYRAYAANVPLLLPRLSAWHEPGASEAAIAAPFSFERWRRNREHQALMGALAGFAFLAARMLW